MGWNPVTSKINRLKVLSHYSNGKLECGCCKEKEIKFLCLDHINGGGLKHRKQSGIGSSQGLMANLIRNGFPEGYQILCYNCNMTKGIYGICPHQVIL